MTLDTTPMRRHALDATDAEHDALAEVAEFFDIPDAD